MKRSLWQVPLAAVGGSVVLNVIRALIDRVLTLLQIPTASGYIVYNILGLILIVLGGLLLCRKVPIRDCAISASFVAGYILLYRLLFLTVMVGLQIGRLPVEVMEYTLYLGKPVSIFSVSILSRLYYILFPVELYFVDKLIPFLSIGLPYLYLLFANRSRGKADPNAFEMFD